MLRLRRLPLRPPGVAPESMAPEWRLRDQARETTLVVTAAVTALVVGTSSLTLTLTRRGTAMWEGEMHRRRRRRRRSNKRHEGEERRSSRWCAQERRTEGEGESRRRQNLQTSFGADSTRSYEQARSREHSGDRDTSHVLHQRTTRTQLATFLSRRGASCDYPTTTRSREERAVQPSQ